MNEQKGPKDFGQITATNVLSSSTLQHLRVIELTLLRHNMTRVNAVCHDHSSNDVFDYSLTNVSSLF